MVLVSVFRTYIRHCIIAAKIITIYTPMKNNQNSPWFRECFQWNRSVSLSKAFNRLSRRRFDLRWAVSTNGGCLPWEDNNRSVSK